MREYPTGSLTSQIVGYLGPIGPDEETRLRELGYDPAFDRIGYAGIEAFFEDDLAGTGEGLGTDKIEFGPGGAG
ncbi:MAG: Penicillin-binding Protein dimerization domain protein [Syntrophorhabdus sp. PtaU1.Bin153]|nr:MAG: Penicillin-binding Protein dimerization domain protein [Syntrophorhabdus sp. PtaU1.Bin153]